MVASLNRVMLKPHGNETLTAGGARTPSCHSPKCRVLHCAAPAKTTRRISTQPFRCANAGQSALSLESRPTIDASAESRCLIPGDLSHASIIHFPKTPGRSKRSRAVFLILMSRT